ncbi:MAG: shikimate kinase [Firmicutes bacterium]|nr:shikimate kinase [Bacillota bacterium]MBR5981712.1 shikimate kinase [Bacillota bacterium]
MSEDKKTNIILIGMPGSGKTTIGRILADKLDLLQADGDKIIIESEGRPLQEILDTEGKEYFLSLEGRVLASLSYENYVISPGGSACYYPDAMKHLSEIGHIVYLNVEFPEIERRVTNLETRGIVFKPGQTFEDLYNERTPLYEKYAEFTVCSTGQEPEETANEVLKLLGYEIPEE